MLKQIAAYQTSDGRVHESHLMALINEQKIEIRGILQSANPSNPVPLRSDTVHINTVAEIIASNIDSLAGIARKYNKMIRNEREKGAAGK